MELRSQVPVPPEARTLALAERFSMWPADIESKPMDEILRWTRILGVEGEVLTDRAGLTPDDPLFYEDEDEDGDEDGDGDATVEVAP